MSSAMWSARRPVLLGLATLLILLGGLGAWVTLAQISGAIIVPAQVEIAQNRQLVQHADGGIIAEIHVTEGKTVAAGDVLLRLDPEALLSELHIIEGKLHEIIARRGRLEAERDAATEVTFAPALLAAAATRPEVQEQLTGQQQLFTARRASRANEIAQLNRRSAQITDQITGIHAQIAALEAEASLIARELTDQQTLLGKGLAQAQSVLTLQRQSVRLSGAMGELHAQRAQAEGRITDITLEIIKLESRHREEAIARLRDLHYQELELAEQRRALQERLSRLYVRAPVSGVVYGLQVFGNGTVIRAAQPLLHLVPQDKPLVIMAQIPPIHIEALYLDQPVTLRLTSFDTRNTPVLFGHVTNLSADAFRDETTAQGYYRAEIALDDGTLSRLPAGATLLPGMPVEAYFRTSDRTPLHYLTKPLTDYFAKAFREG
ncbi:HlyD family type I secretion periplasmic adaptor subunit [Pelagovum sp. HNIBRBA483]|uniref:HlyD family type I secretion periplasmic adaptor subunit n=1 Tax=Pelagovum sp. HNIBRBA483 TaxID=3233341 RepID=UPI0034A43F7F